MQNVTEGGCHCGDLRYRLEGALTDVAHCHCSICRRVSGGLVVTWLTVPRSAFQWLAGEPRCYVAPASCSRYFCGQCGAHVALVTSHSLDSIDVTVATLDHPERVRANRHIWTGSRLPWLHLDEDLPGEVGESL
ncbi:GFA family protein [Pseudomonas kermanshahensis]|uniref:GFA family protein n=1 Tax=Pseudomonas kermanshahensis TaxID=2745482 RepID=UPI0023DBFB63|nr:GFA family protein [Pseudomonas kermanshahensis]WEL55712.1 GFA family protein [Pseudomonas kermanshahensis]